MKKGFLMLLVLLVPFAAFAQTSQQRTPQQRETQLLKSNLGLAESQAAQVVQIQGTVMQRVTADTLRIHTLRAEIAEAMYSANSDEHQVNGLVDRTERTSADMQGDQSSMIPRDGYFGVPDLNGIVEP